MRGFASLNDEAAEGLAIELAGPKPDGLARLAAGMIVLTVHTARQEAIRVFERGGSAKKANAALFALIDQGFTAVAALTAEAVPRTAPRQQGLARAVPLPRSGGGHGAVELGPERRRP
jgi:hypothetical protein